MTGRPPDRVAIRSWWVIGGLLAALVALGVAALARDAKAPPGVSAEEWAFCTDGDLPFGGSSIVGYAGHAYLGWEEKEDWEDDDGVSAAEMTGQPGVGAACRIAFQLQALSQAERDWCKPGTLEAPALVFSAVATLGMGEDEATDSDDLYQSIPGDDSAEFTQACRLAYHHWRQDGRASPIADPLSHPFFALTPQQQAWCGASENRAVLEWMALQLGIETPADAPFIEQLTAYVRSCRIASIAERIPADVPIVHVQDELEIFSPEVRERAEAQLKEIERATRFVGVIVTEPRTGENAPGHDAPDGPEVEGFIEVRYDEIGDCCATVYGPRELRKSYVCCPFVDALVPLFADGRSDEALRAFVTLVENLAGDPEPPPRRLPEDPFRES